MKSIILLLTIICSFFAVNGSSQVVINEDEDISRVMAAYKAIAMQNQYVDGWRIQIINTDDRRQMESARSKFAGRYNHIDMTWEHVRPYYQVKVGAYRTKLELEAFLRELKEDFPRAIPVRDKIHKSELSY